MNPFAALWKKISEFPFLRFSKSFNIPSAICFGESIVSQSIIYYKRVTRKYFSSEYYRVMLWQSVGRYYASFAFNDGSLETNRSETVKPSN